MKSLVKTLTELQSKPKEPIKENDYWQKESEKIAKSMIKIDEDTGNTIVDPAAVLNLLRLNATLIEDVKGIEKQRDREVKAALRQLSADEKDIIGDVVIEELEKHPLGQPISKSDIDRAVIFARGMRHDKLLESIKSGMESDLRKGKREIEGIVDDDDSYVPDSGARKSAGSTKRPTSRQIQLAAERGIPVELQMKFDEKKEKKSKK